MASYHLNVTPISRAQGRSATACAAYRAAELIECEREGRSHDYTRKSGVLHAQIVAPDDAPDWVQDRAALWNGAEASENRKNSVVAREWRVALPVELGAAERKELAMDFAHALVERFGVAADVAVHAPDREGDARNHHAHILTTTRRIGPEGFAEKTRELDDRKRGSVEIDAMRGLWAEQQNLALERVGSPERVDHRSLEVQHAEAERERDLLAERLAHQEPEQVAPEVPAQTDSERLREVLETGGAGGQSVGQGAEQEDGSEDRAALEAEHADAVLRTEMLDREPEAKLGIAANAIERKEQRAAEREGREYIPRTERGAQVHASRQARAMFGELRERLDLARETYTAERDRGQDRISAGLEAIRAAAGREREGEEHGSIAERLAGLLGREKPEASQDRETSEHGIEDRSQEPVKRSPSVEAKLHRLREGWESQHSPEEPSVERKQPEREAEPETLKGPSKEELAELRRYLDATDPFKEDPRSNLQRDLDNAHKQLVEERKNSPKLEQDPDRVQEQSCDIDDSYDFGF